MEIDVKKNVARRMKTRMFELGLTQAGLQRRSNVSDKSISKYMNGKNGMTAQTLAKLAQGLKCSADWLLGLSDKK